MNGGTQLTKSGALSHLKTLEEVVEDYNKRFVFLDGGVNHSIGHDDPVVDYCLEARTLTIAIDRAVDGRRRDGKMFSKGSCVRTSSKLEMAKNLKKRVLSIAKVTDFEQLYQLVRFASPWGIGPMSMYAVTERIGAYLRIRPEAYLYLHAGPLAGWRRLTREVPEDGRVPVAHLPEALRTIELYHVENLLCEYRDLLNPGMLP